MHCHWQPLNSAEKWFIKWNWSIWGHKSARKVWLRTAKSDWYINLHLNLVKLSASCRALTVNHDEWFMALMNRHERKESKKKWASLYLNAINNKHNNKNNKIQIYITTWNIVKNHNPCVNEKKVFLYIYKLLLWH